MEITTEVLNAALAGLLHDIGKIEQRARDKPWEAAPGIDREGQPVHATWSIYFIQNNVSSKYRPAALAGAYHHAPEKSPAADQRLSELTALADKLSAGERADLPKEEGRPPRQMVTIFDRVQLAEEGKQEGWHFLPLNPLELKQTALFPDKPMPEGADLDAYDALADLMRTAARQPIQDEPAYLENLLGAMQRAAWCVPSAYYYSVPDVSLYDHSRMTSALAACLSEKPAEEVKLMLKAVQRDFLKQPEAGDAELLAQPAALLVGGDISGVQDFIYTISSKGAARTLRGRSFYLQILTEAVLRFTLAELGLPYSNVIYSGGGHFFLLAPTSAAEKIPEIRKAIAKKMLKHHGTALYLAIGFATVPFSGFRVGEFPYFWDEMHRAVARAKQQRFSELAGEFYTAVFQPPAEGGNPESTCAVCGDDRRKVTKLDEEREEQAKICSLCESFAEQIGKRLPHSHFIALGFGQPKQVDPGTAQEALAEFGMSFQLLENASQKVELDEAERLTLWALDDPKDGKWPECPNIPTAYTLRYTVNRVPPLTFDELRDKTEGGFKRLGVLRMDVDNLGEIFSQGLGERATLARLSTLSFQMSLFFDGWVKHLCETAPYQGLIYAVYAGGDDLFLIGPWDRMTELAMSIRGDFNRYIAEHPALHVSGGLAFIGGKYPVYQAAEDAEKAEKEAKSLEGKDAFSFLGQAWHWHTFDELSKKKERVLQIVTRKESDPEGLEGPQQVIQALRQFAQDEAEAVKSRGRPIWGRWLWIGPYQLTRMAEREEKRKPELARALKRLRDELGENNYSEIAQWGAAARWAQLLTRK